MRFTRKEGELVGTACLALLIVLAIIATTIVFNL